MVYEVIIDDFGHTKIWGIDEFKVRHFIPQDPDNRDYQEYLASLEGDA